MDNKKKIENISLILIVAIILLVPVYLIKEKISKARIDKESQTEHTFVGRSTCIECHAKEYQAWEGSHHDLAMDYANDSTVLGDFNNVELVTQGNTHKFYKKDDKFFVFTDGENGEMQEFEVKYTFGYTPLQQYLVEFDGGRLQTLPLTWNTVDSNWYHMVDSIYKNEKVDHKNWLHWTNQAQNWNGMCADCHSTNLVKGYNVETDTYNTTWSEIDVSCEACHGPASQHLEWANLPKYSRNGFTNYGLTVQTSNLDSKAYVEQCARCHTRRGALSDYKHGNSSFYNHMIPSLPTEPDFHIDGQILDEDYVYTSFTQSKMYMNGIKCNDCHDVHSTKRLFEGNALCLQCHKADNYDTKNHHFHKDFGEKGEAVISESGVRFEVGEGTQCVNCHMHGQYFMGIDYRNDHSFRNPRPDLSKKLGTPNACNQCHANETNDWAQAYIEKWYGKRKRYQYGEAFALARDGSDEGFEKLKGIYSDDLYPEIVRSTAIEFMGTQYQDSAKSILFEALLNLNVQIRYTALRSLNISDNQMLDNILPLLYDEVKAIRIEVASKLMGIDSTLISENYKEVLKQVSAEYLETLKHSADFPGGKFNLANYYYNHGILDKAEKFYIAALKQDNQLHDIKINLAYLYNTQGKSDKAALLFESYLETNPNNGAVLFSYGLLLSELTRYNESLEYLLKANKVQPLNARIDYNIAMMHDFLKNEKEAERFLIQSITKDTENFAYYSALLNFYVKHKHPELSNLAKQMLAKFPNVENINQLNQFVEE